MTHDELRSCPFCGGEAIYQSFNASTLYGRVICGCGAEIRQGKNESKQDVIDAWNRRAR